MTRFLMVLGLSVTLVTCTLFDDLPGDDDDVLTLVPEGTTPSTQSYTFDPGVAQELFTDDGVGLLLPADSLETDSGDEPTGDVTADLTRHIFPESEPWNMPGGFLATDASGLPGALTSFGVIEIVFTDESGNDLDLKSGQVATIGIPPLAGGPASAPLWYLDEAGPRWIEDGAATLMDGTYVAEVTHFTKWNVDILSDEACISGTVVDGDGVGISGAVVTATLVGSPGLNGNLVYTQSNGSYLLSGLVSPAQFEVAARYGEDSASVQVVVPAAGTACILAPPLVIGPEPEPTGFAGSCDSVAAQGICINYTGSAYTFDDVTQACTGYIPEATPSTEPCAEGNVLGTCAWSPAAGYEMLQVYDATYYTLESAQGLCAQQGGAWSDNY